MNENEVPRSVPEPNTQSFEFLRDFIRQVIGETVDARFERLEGMYAAFDTKLDVNTKATLQSLQTMNEVKDAVKLGKMAGAIMTWLVPLIAAIASIWASLKGGWHSKP